MEDEQWQEVRLGDLLQVKHGWPFKSEYFSDVLTGQPIVVAIGNFDYSGGFRFESTLIKEYRGPYPRDFTLSSGDILLVMTCQTEGGEILGIPARVPDDGRAYLHNQRIGRVVVQNPERVDSGFLYYLFMSSAFNRHLVTTASGTKILHTSPSRVESFQFRLPPITQQRAIARILGTLDDKIELNRRMNETLEALARALFKSWFVDFDPVRAKAEGRDPGLPQPIADLFPDSFEDSEMGEIPAGWEVTALADVLVELETGGRPKGGVSGYATGVPSIGAESIVGLGVFDYSKTKYVPQEFFDRMTKGRLRSRDVLLYKDGGRPGEFEPHVTLFGDGFPFDTCAINEHVYRMRAKKDLGQNLLFLWLSSDFVMDEMRIKGTGVAIPGLNSTQVRSLATLVPSCEVARAVDAVVDPIITRVLANSKESRTLAKLRDALLPKLISGALRVKDAEQFVESEVR